MLHRLEWQGFVNRTVFRSNGGEVLIEVTESGRAFVRDAKAPRRAALVDLLERIPVWQRHPPQTVSTRSHSRPASHR